MVTARPRAVNPATCAAVGCWASHARRSTRPRPRTRLGRSLHSRRWPACTDVWRPRGGPLSSPGRTHSGGSPKRSSAGKQRSRCSARAGPAPRGRKTLAPAPFASAHQTDSCSQARSFLPWGLRGRCAEPNRAVLLINRRANRLERLAFRLHRHHVTRDVQADVSAPAVVGERDRPSRQAFGHITIGVMLVANASATTKARDVL
jgi:hypothetical protein